MSAHCWVYALASLSRPYIYVGITQDLEDRVRRHQGGRERTTKPYRPFEILHVEQCPDRATARKREQYLKSGQGKEFLYGLLEQKKADHR
ncbi:MAG: GIY-YIG nuclease family protein [Flavobacteriales bacterium]|nr:GIY-YIG nuclease family protein [Flavobacteriales bacterium]MCB9178943.1 GIY-YIG nuclease family protein [Flavobacteriales bacterium]HPF89826.1 GIY-YIG nuclease family protein [Flavobacteriales bacterium]